MTKLRGVTSVLNINGLIFEETKTNSVFKGSFYITEQFAPIF